jgi:hypothetical protein
MSRLPLHRGCKGSSHWGGRSTLVLADYVESVAVQGYACCLAIIGYKDREIVLVRLQHRLCGKPHDHFYSTEEVTDNTRILVVQSCADEQEYP